MITTTMRSSMSVKPLRVLFIVSLQWGVSDKAALSGEPLDDMTYGNGLATTETTL
jgi:hypothetical protein